MLLSLRAVPSHRYHRVSQLTSMRSLYVFTVSVCNLPQRQLLLLYVLSPEITTDCCLYEIRYYSGRCSRKGGSIY